MFWNDFSEKFSYAFFISDSVIVDMLQASAWVVCSWGGNEKKINKKEKKKQVLM